MDRLWSPWRSDYVSTYDTDRRPSATDGSIFSRLIDEENDEENLILWRGHHVVVLMNLHPYNNGHLLIVPYREVGRYEALSREERHAVSDGIDRCLRWLRRALDPDGFNVGMNLGRSAGASIEEHVHVHVVPRWDRDTNYMTTTTETRVLPEDLTTTYRTIRRAIRRDDGAGADEDGSADDTAP